MKTKNGFRRGLGMDLIAGMLLLVFPMFVFVVFEFTEYWKLMRLDNQMKMLGYAIGGQMAEFKDRSEIKWKDGQEKHLADLYCAKGQTGFNIPSGTVTAPTYTDRMIEVITRVPVDVNYYGFFKKSTTTGKFVENRLVFPSIFDLNGSFIFECK